MTEKNANLVGTDGRERKIKGGASVTTARGQGTMAVDANTPGMDILDAEGKAIAWVNPDATWLIGFTEEETTKQ